MNNWRYVEHRWEAGQKVCWCQAIKWCIHAMTVSCKTILLQIPESGAWSKLKCSHFLLLPASFIVISLVNACILISYVLRIKKKTLTLWYVLLSKNSGLQHTFPFLKILSTTAAISTLNDSCNSSSKQKPVREWKVKCYSLYLYMSPHSNISRIENAVPVTLNTKVTK